MRFACDTLLNVPVQQFAVADVERHPQTGVRLLLVAVVAVAALLVDGTASGIITAGLSYQQGRTAATPDESSWFVTAFNAPYYATILLSPWLYARFGRKTLLLGGLLGFGICSVILALIDSYHLTVVLRFLQGMFLGCVFVPAALLLLTSLPLAITPRVIPAFTCLVLVAGIIGTLIGGYLSESFGAAALYVPGAIFTLIAAALVWRYSHGYDAPQPRLRFDIIGYTLSLLMFGAMQYLANEGERRNWLDSESVVWAIVLLAFALPAFIIWEVLIASRPHANLRLFAAYRNLLVAGAINMVLGAVGYAVTLFSTYLQNVASATITLAGAIIALRAVTYLVGIAFGFFILSRRLLDIRLILVSTAVASAIALYGFAYAMTPTAEAATFVGVSLGFGLVFAMLSQPVPSLVIGGLPIQDLPAGIAIYKITVPLGLMAGTAFISSLVDHRAAFHASQIAASFNESRPPITTFASTGPLSLLQLNQLVVQQAQAVAYRDAMVALCFMLLLVVPLALFVIPPKPQPPPSPPSSEK